MCGGAVSSDPDSRKRALRGELRARLRGVTPDEAAAAGEAAARHLVASCAWKRAHSVLVYAAVGGEVDARPIAAAAWSDGKRVALPSPRPSARDLQPVWWQEGSALTAGPYGIGVPAGGDLAPDVDLAIVPGLAFDSRGGRLGSGLGYYDRWLTTHARTVTVGLGHGWQVVADVPVLAHDRRLAWILTPDALVAARLDTSGLDP